jgi:hypothetical protein
MRLTHALRNQYTGKVSYTSYVGGSNRCTNAPCFMPSSANIRYSFRVPYDWNA